MKLIFLTLMLQAPGDRLFAVKSIGLLRAPRQDAPIARLLKPGDELAELDPPTDELTGRGLPPGWCLVETVDVPSSRSFSGFVLRNEVTAEPLPVSRRTALLRQALDEALAALESREKPFGDLRGQVLAWRARLGHDANAPAQVQALSDQLARYMETEITPRAMDAQDFLGELRELGDPHLGPLSRRFDKAAAAFRP
jgi:hypothetical protein